MATAPQNLPNNLMLNQLQNAGQNYISYAPAFTTSGIGTSIMPNNVYNTPVLIPPTMKMIYPFEFRISDFIIKQEDEVKFHDNGDIQIKKSNGPTFILSSEEERTRLNTLQYNVLKELLEQQKFFNDKIQIEQEKYNQLQSIYNGPTWISQPSSHWIAGTSISDPTINWKVSAATGTMMEDEKKKFQLKNLWTSIVSNTTEKKK